MTLLGHGPGVSFDHLVGGNSQRERNAQTECLCGVEIDRQLELRRLLDGQIGRFGASQDAVGV